MKNNNKSACVACVTTTSGGSMPPGRLGFHPFLKTDFPGQVTGVSGYVVLN